MRDAVVEPVKEAIDPMQAGLWGEQRENEEQETADPPQGPRTTRREVLRRLGLAGGLVAALPLGEALLHPAAAAGLPCEPFDAVPLGSQLTVFALNPVPANLWQRANAEFWGGSFTYSNGPTTTNGFAQIDNRKLAGGTLYDVGVNNITLCFGANLGQTLRRIRFAFGEYGGNLNLWVNGKFANFKNFRDLHGRVIEGVGINVQRGGFGNDTGIIELRGRIFEQRRWGHLAVGGQELWIDDWCWE